MTNCDKYWLTLVYFKKKRKADLWYQPWPLRHVTDTHEIGEILEAIDETMSQPRTAYFRYFLELMGEPYVPGGGMVMIERFP